ncbi:MAG: HAD-IA family hydrolase [Anaerolineales bacterium]|nr:HAD-IA family hydrolase [Anaerolineales bacterium]
MTLSAVLFDRDGVLTHFDAASAAADLQPLLPISLPALVMRWQAYGARHGFPADKVQEQRFFEGFWSSIGDELGIDQSQRERLRAFDYYRYIRAYPDAAPMLAQLKAAGFRIGVLSNFSLASLDTSLARVGLGEWIDVAVSATVIGAAKPAPAAYLAALDALQVAPEACCFFDDELANVVGARELGITGFLVERTRGEHDLATGTIADLTGVWAAVHSL